MSNPQMPDQIGPMQEQVKAPQEPKKPTNPIEAEFEEGKTYLSQGNVGQAAVAFHNVLLAHEEKGDEAGIANACNQLGHVCLKKEDYASAEKHYLRAWDICEKNDDPMSMIALNLRFVEVYRGLKNYRKSIDICLDLLQDYKNNFNQDGTVQILEIMAEIFLEDGDKKGAADAYKTIASIHKNFKHDTIAQDYFDKAAELQ